MPYATVTSSKANEDFQNIKQKHADIITGITNQKMRVDQFNQQKQQEQQVAQQNQQVMAQEMKTAEMTNKTVADKNAMDFHLKNTELNIKRAALSQP